MPIKVMFQCGGCDARAEGTDWLKMGFESFSGRTHGFGRVIQTNSVQDVAPEGWVAYDPYTFCTYCPKCVDEIWPNESKTKEER